MKITEWEGTCRKGESTSMAAGVTKYGLMSSVATKSNSSTKGEESEGGRGLLMWSFAAILALGTKPWEVGREERIRCWFRSGT